MSIIRPRYIALDSSHLGRLADDANSGDAARRAASAAFLDAFDRSGCILLLCWHHFEELLRHGDNAVVARRIAFFRSLSMIASIAPIATDGALGSVLDILIFEVAEAFKDPHASSITIRDRVMQKLFRYKKGSEVVGPYVAFLGPMREEFRRREELNREIVAISRSRYIDIGKTKVTDWLKGRWREPEDAEKRLASMSRQLADDIRKHGDKRISDASAIATRFIDSVRSNAGMAQGSRKHPPADKLLPEDVDNVDIGPDMTVDELGDLAVFRRRLRLANAILDLPWPDLKRELRKLGFLRASFNRRCSVIDRIFLKEREVS